MPINISKADTGEKLAWLCDKIWDLPNQIDALDTWLLKTGKDLHASKYVAYIGFDIRNLETTTV